MDIGRIPYMPVFQDRIRAYRRSAINPSEVREGLVLGCMYRQHSGYVIISELTLKVFGRNDL